MNPASAAPATTVVLKRRFSRGGLDAQLWRPGDQWPPSVLSEQGREGDWIAQEFISDAEPISSFTVIRDGCLIAHVSYVCELTTGTAENALDGFACLRTSIDCDETVEATAAVVAQLRREQLLPTGSPPFHFGLDFVRSSADGKLYCLECNPRATNGVALLLADATTGSMAVAAYRSACHERVARADTRVHPLVIAPANLSVRTTIPALAALLKVLGDRSAAPTAAAPTAATPTAAAPTVATRAAAAPAVGTSTEATWRARRHAPLGRLLGRLCSAHDDVCHARDLTPFLVMISLLVRQALRLAWRIHGVGPACAAWRETRPPEALSVSCALKATVAASIVVFPPLPSRWSDASIVVFPPLPSRWSDASMTTLRRSLSSSPPAAALLRRNTACSVRIIWGTDLLEPWPVEARRAADGQSPPVPRDGDDGHDGDDDLAYAKRYLRLLVRDGADVHVANADGVVCGVALLGGRVPLPLSKPRSDRVVSHRRCSYTTSAYAQFAQYVEDEVRFHAASLPERLHGRGLGPRWLCTVLGCAVALLLHLVLRGWSRLCDACGVVDTIYLNSWLLSTSLHTAMRPNSLPDAVEQHLTLRAQMRGLTSQLVSSHPGHVLAYRSLDERSAPGLLAVLDSQGWLRIPARYVHYQQATDPALWAQNNVQHDMRLERNRLASAGRGGTYCWHTLTVADMDSLTSPAVLGRIVECYNLLYVDKYSPSNPMFTAAFIESAVRQRLLTVLVLIDQARLHAPPSARAISSARDDEHGCAFDGGHDWHAAIDGVLGYYTRGRFMTTP